MVQFGEIVIDSSSTSSNRDGDSTVRRNVSATRGTLQKQSSVTTSKKVTPSSSRSDSHIELAVSDSSKVDEYDDETEGVYTNDPDQFAVTDTEIRRQIHYDIYGPQVIGWKKHFYKHDIFSTRRAVVNSEGFNNISVLLNIVFRMSVVAYFIYATLIYLGPNNASVKYSLQPSYDMNPIAIKITTSCNSNWGCYNWTNLPVASWTNSSLYKDWDGILVTSTYTNVNKKYCKSSNSSTWIRTSKSISAMEYEVCYSSNFNDGILLSIPFSDGYMSGQQLTVDVAGVDAAYSNKMQFQMQMDPTQNKIVYLSQVKAVVPDKPDTYEPYVADQFYNGHGAATRATLLLKLQQFSYVSETVPKITYLEVLTSTG